MAAVAGTIVTSELSGISDGDTAKVGADTQDHQPLRLLHSLAVSLRISVMSNNEQLFRIRERSESDWSTSMSRTVAMPAILCHKGALDKASWFFMA